MRCFFLLLAACAVPAVAQVKITQGSDRIMVEINGKPFTDLFIGADTMKPYMHPLRAATGTVVTRAFPMDLVEGEARDHPHHRGLWFTHGDVNGIDFWANEKGTNRPNLGRVVLKRVGELKSGKKNGSMNVQFEWLAPDGTALLTENRMTTFYAEPLTRTMDLEITLTALQKVKFGDTKEGTFAIRLAAPLEEPQRRAPAKPVRTGLMVSAEGAKGEKDVWGKRSPWVDYYGKIGEEPVGVAIFDHPSNPKHPTYWHSRSYGLFAANVFGEHDFYNDKTKDGSMTLEPGQSVTFWYRVVIHPGDPATAGIASLYQKFAELKPPKKKK